MNTSASPSSSSQLKTIVTLFVILRVTILLMYTPQGLLNAYVDFQHYYRVASLSDQDYVPFVNSWSEHPPLQAYTSLAVYRFVRTFMPAGELATPTYQFFARILGALMLVFETGVLILLHRIAARAWDIDRANWLAWVYSALSVPLFYWNASQTSNFVFFTLLAVYWFMTDKRTASAVAVALGMLIKLTPVFLLGSAVRFLWPTRSLWPNRFLWPNLKPIARYVVVVAVVFGLAFVPFVLLGGTSWTIASLASNFVRASWSTPWALIDGNWAVGDVGPVPARLQLDLAYQVYGNPSVIPSIVVLAVFGLIFLWLCRRPIEARNPQHFIWFTTLMLLLFHLWSKGWSPQWAMLIIPFVLLSFPDRRGLGLVLALTGIIFVEWPLSDALGSHALLAVAIIARTVLFVSIGVLIGRQLWPRRSATR